MARVDAELVRRGLARSRGQAAELVRSGRVRAAAQPVTKVSQPVESTTLLEVDHRPEDADVGRGAAKLRGALADLDPGPSIQGRRCVDVGAGTGGFTQVLLERGAREVVALDVGHDQLAQPLRDDPRVRDRSGTTVRGVRPDDLGGAFDLLVADLSFISLALVLTELVGLVSEGGDLLVLVKPQFELGRDRLSRDGVVRSSEQRRETVQGVRSSMTGAGLTLRGEAPSRVIGASGNAEHFIWAAR